MRIRVTERREPLPLDLRPAAELAPSLALPWIVTLRYGVLGGQAALLLLARFALGVELPLPWLALPLAVTAASNALLPRFAARYNVRVVLGSVLALDILCLTALLALSGGPANPFSLLYLVQIALSAVVLSKEWTWALGVLSTVSFGCLFLGHVHVHAFEGHQSSEGFSTHLVGMWIAFAAAALLITIFIGKVSEALRKREQEVLLLQGRLARHARLASIVTLAAGAAHELGTPLGTIAIASRELELYAANVSRDPAVAEDARLIRAEVERCSRILQQMSARGAEPLGETPAPLPLREFVEQVRETFPQPARGLLRAEVSGDPAAPVLPAEATRQALVALARNALDASGEGQTVVLGAECRGDTVRFTVADSGCGMGPDTLERIAEPFFTTKAPGRGMGLGTFLARVFAERLGGSLTFESEIGKGTQAVLELPVSRP